LLKCSFGELNEICCFDTTIEIKPKLEMTKTKNIIEVKYNWI